MNLLRIDNNFFVRGMISRDIDDERLQELLVNWDILTQDEIKEATKLVQKEIDDLEVPPIMYDNSVLRPPTEEERKELLKMKYFYGTYAPDARSGDAELMVVCKDGKAHSALAFELNSETERHEEAVDYSNVVLFAPVLDALQEEAARVGP